MKKILFSSIFLFSFNVLAQSQVYREGIAIQCGIGGEVIPGFIEYDKDMSSGWNQDAPESYLFGEICHIGIGSPVTISLRDEVYTGSMTTYIPQRTTATARQCRQRNSASVGHDIEFETQGRLMRSPSGFYLDTILKMDYPKNHVSDSEIIFEYGEFETTDGVRCSFMPVVPN